MTDTAVHADPIDRTGPIVRPDRPVIMDQDWHHVLFLHWPVPVAQLRPLVPAELDIDLFDGQAYVGLTPLTMTGVRPRGVPSLPVLSRFHETNVRTYVHRRGRDPGVWFLSLDASNALAVVGAQGAFGLPYRYARIGFDNPGGRADGPLAAGAVIDYRLRRRWPGPTPAHCTVRYAPQGPVAIAPVGSLEFFLMERYLLYTVWRGGLYRSRIHHAPWPLQVATVPALDETLVAATGLDRPRGMPPQAHYARHVQVEVFLSERVE
jgi:uncharacterized protein YqjF (DUF2071 family)